jgi:hypothetical protein
VRGSSPAAACAERSPAGLSDSPASKRIPSEAALRAGEIKVTRVVISLSWHVNSRFPYGS